jgi:6-phosphogluconolactonase
MASHGMTPFGFDFGNGNNLFVSEAFGGQPNLSAASSYRLLPSGSLQLVSGSVPTTQTAACWLVVDRSGRYAYTTNTGSRTVSLFRIGSGGSLTLVPGLGQTPAGGAIDAAFSRDGRFLHVLTANAASIVTFRIQPDGTLVTVNSVPGPVTAAGLASN